MRYVITGYRRSDGGGERWRVNLLRAAQLQHRLYWRQPYLSGFGRRRVFARLCAESRPATPATTEKGPQNLLLQTLLYEHWKLYPSARVPLRSHIKLSNRSFVDLSVGFIPRSVTRRHSTTFSSSSKVHPTIREANDVMNEKALTWLLKHLGPCAMVVYNEGMHSGRLAADTSVRMCDTLSRTSHALVLQQHRRRAARRL